MHTVNIITGLVENHEILAYAIIFFGLIFEGELVVISAGILSHLGALNFWFVLFFILLGALSKTFFGYHLGKFLYKKLNHHKFFRYVQKRVYNTLPRFRTRPFWSIFISKFIMGLNYLVVLFCGYERIDFKKYLKAEISSSIIWAPTLLSLGYFFGYTAFNISREIWRFSLVVLVLLLLFIIFDKLIGWLFEVFEEFYDDVQ